MCTYVEMVNKYCQKRAKRTSKRSTGKVPKSFWRKTKKKGKKKAWDRHKNLSEEEKEEKKHQYHQDWNKHLPEEEKKKKLSIWGITI